MTTVALLGSTGSVGTQAVEVIRAERERYEVVALAANRSIEVLAAQAAELRPLVVALGDDERAPELKELLPAGIELRAGDGAIESVAADAEVVLNAVVGFAGLPVTMAALGGGRRLALANKESLIAAAPVVQRVRQTPGAEILPVDSEHCAVHQCLRGNPAGRVSRIVLTASGGPFRGRSAADLAGVTIADALAHPTWSMGPKITIDSSTLMNKGLEVIEAQALFGLDYDRIEVVVHPQSVVHSMVEFTDGATIAQLSLPDMRLPIGYALAYPDRLSTPFGAIDWTSLAQLDFEAPDLQAFPCLALAYEAGRAGGSAPAWLSAANEVAVATFLDGLMPWAAIADVIKATLDRHDGGVLETVADVVDADRRARDLARQVVERRAATA
ncbi:MAG: 1-deoxy-D-xylulose 5-phosphate reductoisomerase [uncultured Acidimicrobiales bacterium]|uniref:1-deoxy-D-xylulose 5-phosphate reductoisomerase n=1 Tax=uncultured Acidimicrobiales bacterium TaxID=310071 RepID=A0A6J4HP87_9ACTN|nr:MAG: 1-deoxy-D-xylulose 5-phosphate reductoisomerase [uncultured Acidimicrobiales bacterium]